MTYDATEIRSLSASIGKAIPAVLKGAEIVLTKTSTDIEGHAKRIAPRDPARPPQDPTRKVTGNLRNSIGTSTPGPLSREIGPTAEYGEFQELGTSTIPPRPFMGPAADEHAPAFEQAMAILGEKALGG